ncbi:hypothetical protein WN59_05860 [Salinicoccus sediminis]|uniref:ABC transporter domain-containing protein n=1 Tax=Salinicoccus sediminis TaxID=1432562 RepID=A0A0M2SLP1_9STAP|nr:ABC transporter ATP-binding protein [Salinicoccus sediminis]KKK35148.1 hypothetical protein WN59_05860 [Salinicoccus sediminis]
MLTIEKLEMDYGKFQMTAENMDFGQGLHVILGPNGSGKSSLMRGIIGYGGASMTKRAVYYEGERVLKTHRFLSYLPQNNPRFRLSVREYTGLTADAGNRALQDSLLEMFNLKPLSENTVEELSGGEFKRVQCAQIAMEQKAVLLLDEVEQGLDLKYQHRILKWMKGEAAKKTVIANMHDVPLAMTYADTITMMRDGKVLVQGIGPEDVTSAMLSDCYSIPLTVERREGRPWVFHAL